MVRSRVATSGRPARSRAALLGGLAVAGLLACGREVKPVARLAVAPTAVSLAYPAAAAMVFTWEPGAPLAGVQGAPRVFVHLLAADGNLVRTFDHPFPAAWQPGTPVRDAFQLYQSALGPPLDPGDYRLTVGLYDEVGDRWPLDTRGEELKRLEYVVAAVRVPGGGPQGVPELGYSAGWQPPEPGGDRQILGRRWLGGDGEITVAGGAAGRLHLALVVPPPGDGLEMRLAGDAVAPAVRVTSTCDGSETMVSGSGSHAFEVAVPAGARCTVRFEPGYQLVWRDGGPLRTTYLENLYWEAAAAS